MYLFIFHVNIFKIKMFAAVLYVVEYKMHIIHLLFCKSYQACIFASTGFAAGTQDTYSILSIIY